MLIVMEDGGKPLHPSEIQRNFKVINRNLIYLPILEDFSDDEGPENMTSYIADPLEHFIHHPERTLSEYGWSKEKLKSANWPALKIMWQRMLADLIRHGEIPGVTIGKDGWGTDDEEGVEFIPFEFDISSIQEAEYYDPKRNLDEQKRREDYLWLRKDLIKRVGKYNKDEPQFGLPKDLFD